MRLIEDALINLGYRGQKLRKALEKIEAWKKLLEEKRKVSGVETKNYTTYLKHFVISTKSVTALKKVQKGF